MILIPQKVKEQLKKRWWWYILEFSIFAIILTLDLVSKDQLSKKMSGTPGSEKILIKGLLSLTYAENTGGAFSTLSGATTFLTVITSLLLIGIGTFLVLDLKQGLQIRIPLILIVGGGMGNLVDRIKFGWVRDFFKFSFNWGIFNVADIFISHGAIILVIVLIVQLVKEFKKDKNKEPVPEGSQEPEVIEEVKDTNFEESNDLENSTVQEKIEEERDETKSN